MSRSTPTPPVPAQATRPSPGPGPDAEALRHALQRLKLDHAAEALTRILGDAVRDDLGHGAFLDCIIQAEITAREERRIRTSLKLSGLPAGITLAGFDFAFQPAIERRRIETLATGQWIRDRQSLLLLGPPGVGKSHLAAALGVAAIERGLSVTFYRIEELLHDLRRDARMPPAQLKRRKYMNASLLIIDEVGFEALAKDDANLFFRLVSYRYQRGSILITSNKSIRDWPELFAGDETIATAILDRLLHASHVLNIKGRSYRLRDLDDQLGRQN